MCQNLHGNAAGESEGKVEEILMVITSNEEVKHHWSLVARNWEEEESDVWLHMLAKHYLTIHGFSAFMEEYKIRNMRTHWSLVAKNWEEEESDVLLHI